LGGAEPVTNLGHKNKNRANALFNISKRIDNGSLDEGGSAMPETRSLRMGATALSIASFIMGLALAGCGPTVSSEQELQNQVEKQQLGMTTLMKKLVGTYARSEDSLRFRNETLYHQGGPLTKDGKLAWPPGWVLCGELSGKNGFGGYHSFVAIITVRFNDQGVPELSSVPMYQESDKVEDNPLKQFCHTDETVK
jgi:hypothetical protein